MVENLCQRSGSRRKALPDVRELSGVSPGCPREVGRPSLISGRGRETILDVQERLEDPPRHSGLVGTPSRMSLSGGRPSRMSGRVLEALPYVWVWSRVPPECPGVDWSPSRMSGVVRIHSRMSRSGQVDLPDVREWSGGPPGCPRVDVRPFQMSRSGGRSPDVRENSRLSKSVRKDPGCPGVVGKTSWISGRPSRMSRRPSRMSGSGCEAVPDVRERLEDLPGCL